MSQHFLREIDTLDRNILTVGAVVEERIAQAITAVVKHDAALAQQVAEGDDEIDEMEVEVEEDCLKILALYQPVAIDLRFVVAVLKMNNDLSRLQIIAGIFPNPPGNLAHNRTLTFRPAWVRLLQKFLALRSGTLNLLLKGKAALAGKDG